MGLLQAVNEVQERRSPSSAAVRGAARARGGLSVDRRAAAPVHRRATSRPWGRFGDPAARATSRRRFGPSCWPWASRRRGCCPSRSLSPVLWGQLVPAPVKLAVAGALGLALRPLAGGAPEGAYEPSCSCGREAAVGRIIGWGPPPVDGARMGDADRPGPWDLGRGGAPGGRTPGVGDRRPSQLLVSLALAGGALPVLVRALVGATRSFRPAARSRG